MAGNKAVAYQGTGRVEVQDIDYPTLELKDGPGVNPANIGRKLPHGAILKSVATNICGSDQHMVRGRTTAPEGLVLGHEITGEVVEVGPGVEFIKVGDLVSVPFNISCGRCRNCKEGKTGICLNVNPDRPGSAYGYVDMGGWVGGQAQYVAVPYADWNLLKFPDKDQALAKILDLAMLSDIFPTGYHGCVTAGVGTGSTVYVAGAGVFEPPKLSSFWYDPEQDDRYRTVEVNLNHPIKLARIAMRELVSHDKPGVILPVASVGGIAGTYHCPLYIATKHGIMGFVKSMELAERYEGIKIVTVCPGAVDTPLWDEYQRKRVKFETFEALQPDDIAAAMIDLVQEGKYGGGTALEVIANKGPQRRVIPKWNIDAPKGGSTTNVDTSKEVPPAFQEARSIMDKERGAAKK